MEKYKSIKNLKLIKIDRIMLLIQKYFPLETNETLAKRIGLKQETFDTYQRNQMAPWVYIRDLIKTFFETDYNAFFYLVDEDKDIQKMLKLEANWSWFKNRYIKNISIEGSTFDSIYEIWESENKSDYYEKEISSEYTDTLFDEENIEYEIEK